MKRLLVVLFFCASLAAQINNGGGGSSSWSALTNPSGNLTLSNGANTTTYNTTSALSQFFAWKNTTAATAGTSQGSPVLVICGRAFHGSADVEDCLTLSELPGNGNDAAITFTIGHTGSSTGVVTTALPGPVQTGGAPTCTAGTAGSWCANEGTAFTNVSGAAGIYPDATAHEFLAKTNGSANTGVMVRAQPGSVNQLTQTALINTATLCAASAGACNVAGTYHVHFDFWGSGTACSNVAAGSVTFLLSWTDPNGTAHAAVALQMMAQTGAATTAMQGTFPFQTALANESAGGDFTFDTNGTVIQYATGYTACTTGTGTYNLSAVVTRLR